jgi:hypothetical protein
VRKKTLEALPSQAHRLDKTEKSAATDKLDKTLRPEAAKPEKKTAA